MVAFPEVGDLKDDDASEPALHHMILLAWCFMASHHNGIIWCCTALHGIVWHCMVSYGVVWHRTVSYGGIWHYMASHGIVWCHMAQVMSKWSVALCLSPDDKSPFNCSLLTAVRMMII